MLARWPTSIASPATSAWPRTTTTARSARSSRTTSGCSRRSSTGSTATSRPAGSSSTSGPGPAALGRDPRRAAGRARRARRRRPEHARGRRRAVRGPRRPVRAASRAVRGPAPALPRRRRLARAPPRPTHDEKRELYRAILAALEPGGLVVVGDALRVSRRPRARRMVEDLYAHMGRNGISAEEAAGHFAPWAEEDFYVPLPDELALIAAAGFPRPDCFWRDGLSRCTARSRTADALEECPRARGSLRRAGGGAVRRVVGRDVRPGGRRARRRLPRRARGRRRRARARHRHGPDRAAARRARRARARHRPVRGDGRAAAREAGRRGRSASRSATSRRRRVDGTFALAYLVFNTIKNLTTQDEQVACFRNVAAHLEPGGCFVIEVGVPELRRLPPGETFRAFHVSPTRLGFDEYDVARAGPRSRTTTGSSTAGSSAVSVAVPLRLAGRARPDGAARRDDAARAVERLEARAVHEREHEARLRLGEALADDRGERADRGLDCVLVQAAVAEDQPAAPPTARQPERRERRDADPRPLGRRRDRRVVDARRAAAAGGASRRRRPRLGSSGERGRERGAQPVAAAR